eukprot:5818062-Amphidinium_carterae.1
MVRVDHSGHCVNVAFFTKLLRQCAALAIESGQPTNETGSKPIRKYIDPRKKGNAQMQNLTV